MFEIEYNNLIFEISTKIGVNHLGRLVFRCRRQISTASKDRLKMHSNYLKNLRVRLPRNRLVRNFETDFETVEDPIHAQEDGSV